MILHTFFHPFALRMYHCSIVSEYIFVVIDILLYPKGLPMPKHTETLTQQEILNNATMADIARASSRSPRPMRQAIADTFSAFGRVANLADSIGEIAQLSLVSIKADMRKEALEALTNAN